jgi:quercetin dioxygenase-like cupin family protein
MLPGRMLVDSETPGGTPAREQISRMLDGEFEPEIGGEVTRVRRGDAFSIPAGVRHPILTVIVKPIEIIDVWPVSGPEIPS